MKKINLHLYPSTFIHESRILKETRTLAASGLFDLIYLGGLWQAGLEKLEALDDRRLVWRATLRTGRFKGRNFWKLLLFSEWYLKILFRFLPQRIRVVHCHSLSVLPLGLLFKLLGRAKLVYDAHELETETGNSINLRRKLSKLLERFCIGRVDLVLVVGRAIADWYRQEYALDNVLTLENVPNGLSSSTHRSHVFREKFRIPERDLIFIYIGLLDHGRGLELLLEAFAQAPSNRRLVLLGFGPLEEAIKAYAEKHANIHFHPAVRPEEVVSYASGADVGLCLIEPVSLSYYYSMPNKLFEYVLAGLPVLVSDFPEMGRFVDLHGCGWRVRVSLESVIAAITGLSSEEIEAKAQNAAVCRSTLDWRLEEKKLLREYNLILREI